MISLLLALLAAAPLVRTPDKTALPALPTNQVWVFFTDKGVFSEDARDDALAGMRGRISAEALERRTRSRVGGPDFDDLPVRASYVAALERMGARLRRTSAWLNAASFEMSPELARQVYALPFVYDLKPVIAETNREPVPFPLGRYSTQDDSRGLDTAYAHRYYGPSWDQAYMMGVPEVFFKGHYGAGVRLGIFDTGIKLTHRAVARARIWKQHDFLSGDNLVASRSALNWQPVPVPNLAGFGLVRDPAVIEQAEPAGDTLPLLLCFAADSFSYAYGLPRRAVFYSASRDRGVSWTQAAPLAVTSRAFDVTFEGLALATRGTYEYIVYSELTATASGPASSTIHQGWFVNGVPGSAPQSLTSGRHPALAARSDTLFLAFVRAETTLILRRFSIAGGQPNWLVPEVVIPLPEPARGTAIAAAPGRLTLFWEGRQTGNLTAIGSDDGGEVFSEGTTLASGARDMTVVRQQDALMLSYRDESRQSQTSLVTRRSADGGVTWQPPVAVDSGPSVGGFAGAWTASGPALLYELAGRMRRASSVDGGESWTVAGPLDTTGFACWPALAGVQGGAAGLWFRRGDDNAVWEDSDELRFAREQPDHGTRMASIIAGYQQGSIIGIAPACDLLIAKTELHKTRSGRFYEYNMEEDTYVEALEWAEAMGVDIVSASLGYRGWYGAGDLDGRTAPVSIASDMAARRGVVVVAAMGNRDTTLFPWPSPYITAPGDAEGVITAGGVQKTGMMWRGTGSGPTADGRVKPDLVALSDTVTVVSPDSLDFLDGSAGTSCATALIAGVCALVKEAHPTWTADSIRAALFATATRTEKSCTLGFGVPRIDSLYRRYPPAAGVPSVTGDQIGLVFPNPFVTGQHPRVYFQLNLAQPAPEVFGADSSSPAAITVFTVSGRPVRRLPLNTAPLGRPGRYGEHGDVATLEAVGAFWDGLDSSGRPVASGVYTAVLQTTFGRHVTRFAVVR